MHLARGNADLRAHSELAAIRKLRRRIAHQNRTIDPREKALRRRVIFGDDALGVAGTVAANMVNRTVNAVNGFGCDDRVEKLKAEITLRG